MNCQFFLCNPPPPRKQNHPKTTNTHTEKPTTTTNTPKPCCRSLCKGLYSDGPPAGKGLAGMGGYISWSNWNDTSVLLLSQGARAGSSVRLGNKFNLFHSFSKKKGRNIPPPPPHKTKTITNNKQTKPQQTTVSASFHSTNTKLQTLQTTGTAVQKRWFAKCLY